MYCPNCGNRLPDGARFCAHCGAKLTGPEPAARPAGAPDWRETEPVQQAYGNPQGAAQQAYGQPYGSQQQFAANGVVQRPVGAAPQTGAQPEKKKSKLPLILGLIAGLAALVLVFVFVLLPLMRGDDGEAGTQAAGETTKTPEGGDTQDDDEEPNSGYYSMWGAVAHYRGYTYFVADGHDNDCSVNGESASESIWRISDDADAKPEKIYTTPANIEAGTVQSTLFFLAPHNGRIWFYQSEHDKAAFRWISPDGSEQGTVAPPDGFSQTVVRIAYYDDGRYFCRMAEQRPDGEWTFAFMVLDLATETWQPFDASFIRDGKEMDGASGIYVNQDGELAYVLGYVHGYVYFVRGTFAQGDDAPKMEQGLCRARYGSDAVEEVGAMQVGDGEGLELSFVYATEQAFYFVPDDDMDGAFEEGALYAILFADGSTKKILGAEDGFESRDFPSLCIAESEIWYLTDDALYRCDPDGENRQVTGDPSSGSKYAPVICGDWIFYSFSDHPKYARIAKTGRIFPAGPLVDQDFSYPDEQQEGEWKYREYPAYVEICGYTGGETELALPAELAGKPVRTVGSWSEDGFAGVKVLKLPESVTAVNYLYVPGLERIELPAKLELFNHRSFAYTFRTDTELTVVYPGTKEQWDALCAYSEELNDMEGIDAGYGETTYRILCSDAEETLVPGQE